jgi:Calcineurin-like phosphoesterase
MSRTYAIADLHGRVDLLDLAIAAIDRHAAGATARIVTLGDYVDRGPDSRAVIERLMNFRSPTQQLIALKGNHEAMMWEACNNLLELERWLELGGDATLASYGTFADPVEAVRAVPAAHLLWIANLAPLHVDAHRVFVHAGVDPDLSLQRQDLKTLLWKRYLAGDESGHGARHVVHGHHATDAAPVVTKGRTNLDGFGWRSGRLAIGVFADGHSGGATDFLDIRAPAR